MKDSEDINFKDLSDTLKIELLGMYNNIQGQVLNNLINVVQSALPSTMNQLSESINAWNVAENEARKQVSEMAKPKIKVN